MLQLLKYLLTSKHGVRGNILGTLATILSCYAIIFIIQSLQGQAPYIAAQSMDIAVILVVFICQIRTFSNALRFGTANGTSRKSIIACSILIIPCYALPIAAMTGIVNALFSLTDYCEFYTLYCILFDKMNLSLDLLIIERSYLFLFVILIAAALLANFFYAMYNRFGTMGFLCSILVMQSINNLLILTVYFLNLNSKIENLNTLVRVVGESTGMNPYILLGAIPLILEIAVIYIVSKLCIGKKAIRR